MLLELVDHKKIRLEDKLSNYFPDLPEANAVTIKMLANSTSGYADYVYQPGVIHAVELYPFRQWTTAELIKIGTSAPPMFPPGTNWAYSHTNYAILGAVLAKVGGKPLGQLTKQYIFQPMGLKQTQVSATQPAAFNGQGDVTDAGPAIMSTLAKALAPASPIPG
jgi:CubicO group peptidase (beta-lactamase class C family)